MGDASTSAAAPADRDAALPSARYRAGVERGDWSDDPAQHPALQELDRIHVAVTRSSGRPAWIGRLFGRGESDPVSGLYLWGGVGRGKTFLIDLFYDGLPLEESKAEGLSTAPLPRSGIEGDRSQSGQRGESGREPDGSSTASPSRSGTGEHRPQGRRSDGGGKRRTHFHRFMRTVHAQLRAHAGERDPLAAIAHAWRKSLRVLVLDEFFVNDIGDAMLLGRLLDRLFAEGVVLVTSSNAAPTDLYRDGLQRARFEPAIALIERRCTVLKLESDTDYRLRALTRSPVYRAPLDDGSDAWLASRWAELGAGAPLRPGTIELDGRRIPVRSRTKGMAWFDFDALCDGPRSATDYIEIALEFHTLLIGAIPVMDRRRDDAARRFVTLIDELYDRHVNLVCTAAEAPPALYTGERLSGAFERCASRLIEMRSAEYLALEHRS